MVIQINLTSSVSSLVEKYLTGSKLVAQLSIINSKDDKTILMDQIKPLLLDCYPQYPSMGPKDLSGKAGVVTISKEDSEVIACAVVNDQSKAKEVWFEMRMESVSSKLRRKGLGSILIMCVEASLSHIASIHQRSKGKFADSKEFSLKCFVDNNKEATEAHVQFVTFNGFKTNFDISYHRPLFLELEFKKIVARKEIESIYPKKEEKKEKKGEEEEVESPSFSLLFD